MFEIQFITSPLGILNLNNSIESYDSKLRCPSFWDTLYIPCGYSYLKAIWLKRDQLIAIGRVFKAGFKGLEWGTTEGYIAGILQIISYKNHKCMLKLRVKIAKQVAAYTMLCAYHESVSSAIVMKAFTFWILQKTFLKTHLRLCAIFVGIILKPNNLKISSKYEGYQQVIDITQN